MMIADLKRAASVSEPILKRVFSEQLLQPYSILAIDEPLQGQYWSVHCRALHGDDRLLDRTLFYVQTIAAKLRDANSVNTFFNADDDLFAELYSAAEDGVFDELCAALLQVSEVESDEQFLPVEISIDAYLGSPAPAYPQLFHEMVAGVQFSRSGPRISCSQFERYWLLVTTNAGRVYYSVPFDKVVLFPGATRVEYRGDDSVTATNGQEGKTDSMEPSDSREPSDSERVRRRVVDYLKSIDHPTDHSSDNPYRTTRTTKDIAQAVHVDEGTVGREVEYLIEKGLLHSFQPPGIKYPRAGITPRGREAVDLRLRNVTEKRAVHPDAPDNRDETRMLFLRALDNADRIEPGRYWRPYEVVEGFGGSELYDALRYLAGAGLIAHDHMGKTGVRGMVCITPRGQDEVKRRPIVTSSTSRPSVFIVHGHDEGARQAAARLIERQDMEAVILSEQPNGGRTVIEKFEENASRVAFALVLLTPDDLGGPSIAPDDQQQRARQNVVFELGYFVGRLGRGKVCLIKKGAVDIPSDLHGVVYISMEGSWQVDTLKEMRHAGLTIDMNRL